MVLILQVMSMITQTTAVMTVLMIMESLIESTKTFLSGSTTTTTNLDKCHLVFRKKDYAKTQHM